MSENTEFLGMLLRIFNLIAGIINITASILIFAQISLNNNSLLFMLSVILIIIGALRIFNGGFNTQLRNYLRISRVIVGTMILLFAILALSLNLSEITIISLLAIAILINGIQRLLDGSFEDSYPEWFRATSALIGITTIILCAIALFGTSWNILTLIIILAITFLLNGLSRIMNAISTLEVKRSKH